MSETPDVDALLTELTAERSDSVAFNRMTQLAAKKEHELTAANQRIENALAALGEHPDSSVDIAERIGQIRDEGRGHFHTVTNLLQRVATLEREGE